MRKKAIAGQESISISHTHTCCRHCRPLLLSHRSEIETDYSSKFQRIGFVVTRSKLEQFFFCSNDLHRRNRIFREFIDTIRSQCLHIQFPALLFFLSPSLSPPSSELWLYAGNRFRGGNGETIKKLFSLSSSYATHFMDDREWLTTLAYRAIIFWYLTLLIEMMQQP